MSSSLYVNAMLGGCLLGLTAGVKTLFTGRVLGCSGALKGAARLQGLAPWIFVAGSVGGAFLMRLADPNAFVPYVGLDYYAIFGCGLLVGAGTYLANGCTSGHGITGLTRLSRRSIVSTGTFFVVSLLTATLSNSRSFVARPDSYESVDADVFGLVALGFVAAAASIYGLRRLGALPQRLALLLTELVCGATFSMGLVVSGMNRPSVVLDFLDLRGQEWNAALVFVLGGAILVKALVFYGVSVRHDPLLGVDADLPCCKRPHDTRLVAGSALFGIGWGLGGICPGPGLTMLALDNPEPAFAFIGGLMLSYVLFTVFEANQCKIEATLWPNDQAAKACAALGEPYSGGSQSTAGSVEDQNAQASPTEGALSLA